MECSSNHSIRIIVKDSVSKELVSGVMISLNNDNSEYRVDETSMAGYITMDAVQSGTYSIIATINDKVVGTKELEIKDEDGLVETTIMIHS